MKVYKLRELLHFCDDEDDVVVEGPDFDLEISGVQWHRDDSTLVLQLEDYELDDGDIGNLENDDDEKEPIEGECCSVGGRTEELSGPCSESKIKQL